MFKNIPKEYDINDFNDAMVQIERGLKQAEKIVDSVIGWDDVEYQRAKYWINNIKLSLDKKRFGFTHSSAYDMQETLGSLENECYGKYEPCESCGETHENCECKE